MSQYAEILNNKVSCIIDTGDHIPALECENLRRVNIDNLDPKPEQDWDYIDGQFYASLPEPVNEIYCHVTFSDCEFKQDNVPVVKADGIDSIDVLLEMKTVNRVILSIINNGWLIPVRRVDTGMYYNEPIEFTNGIGNL